MFEIKSSSERRTLSTFRAHLIITCAIVTSVFAGIVALSVFVPLAAHLGRTGLAQDAAAGLADHFLFLHVTLWPLIVLSLIACITSAVILHQKMCSPLVRFVHCFKKIEEGLIPERIVIRTADYLAHETDALNDMIDSLSTLASERQQVAIRIEAIIEDLSARDVDPILLENLISAVKSGLHSNVQMASDVP